MLSPPYAFKYCDLNVWVHKRNPYWWLTKLLNGGFPSVVLFVMLYKSGSNFWVSGWNLQVWTVQIIKATAWAVLSLVLFILLCRGGSTFWVCGWNRKVWPFKWRLLVLLCNDQFAFRYFALGLFPLIKLPYPGCDINKENFRSVKYNCGTYKIYTIVKSICVRNI